MIRPGFLSADERSELRALARDGLSEARVTRRANAIVLLDGGWSCAVDSGFDSGDVVDGACKRHRDVPMWVRLTGTNRGAIHHADDDHHWP